MSEPERRPEDLARLREAWEDFEAPAPARSLGEEDERTREAVGWLQSAWEAAVPATPLRAPAAMRERLRARRAAPPRGRRLALAAVAASALLVSAAAILLRGARTVFQAQSPAQPGPEIASAPAPAAAPLPPPTPSSPPLPAAVPDDLPSPRLVASAADRIELRSGPVRFVLFTSPPGANAPGGAFTEELR